MDIERPNGTSSHHDTITKESQVKRLPDTYYSDFLSDVAKERKPSPIRSLFPLEKTPGLISLLAGKPNASTFPFTSLSFNARSPVNPAAEVTLTLDGEDLAHSLQYGDTAGLKGLLDWIKRLQEINHGRKQNEGWRVSIGSGSQDLIYKAVAAMVNRGDSVLVESPVYAGVIPMFQSLHCDQIEVETDSHGICSSSLRAILEQWPAEKPKPKVLYTVPYGCNPTGMTATLERRKEVLKLAREHNFIILEDDPYFYLYYGKAPRYPSYFSLELEEPEVGRVLRFDSLSKILSAGIRIGFASGPEALLTAIDQHTATSNLQTSSLTQAIVLKLLDSWGHEGFRIHTEFVSEFYRQKRDVFEAAMNKHLSGLAEWDTPEAGMFFWFKLLLTDNSAAQNGGDSETIIKTKAFEKGVLALPGTVFLPNGRKTPYVRASFSLTGEEDVDRAIQRLRDAILDARGAAAAV
ncbi:PLP-dependent transferase [Crassisporium funariophilum]|nr:PLP-dependent transferase [Crassisporium funariophilum]